MGLGRKGALKQALTACLNKLRRDQRRATLPGHGSGPICNEIPNEIPEPGVPHAQVHQIDLRAQEHAGDL